MRAVHPLVQVGKPIGQPLPTLLLPEFTLNTGTDVRRVKTSARVYNESIFIWVWSWGNKGGLLQPVMLDVLYPGLNADGNIYFTCINQDESSNIARLTNQVFWETAIEEEFPGNYPTYAYPKML